MMSLVRAAALADHLRATPKASGTTPVNPGTRSRKRQSPYEQRHYKDRWRIGPMFPRLENVRRLATRCNKLAADVASAVAFAAAMAFRY